MKHDFKDYTVEPIFENGMVVGYQKNNHPKPMSWGAWVADIFLMTFIGTLAVCFIIAFIGSMIWGNEGFVELLAGFIR